MPPLERIDTILDVAVFWHLKGVDGYSQPVLGAPVEIPCRWVDNQSLMLTPQGNTIAVDTTAVVDDDIEQFAVDGQPIWSTIVEGIMWHGSVWDLPGTGNGVTPANGIMQIKAFNRTEDMKARHIRRTVGMVRYTDTLPAVVP